MKNTICTSCGKKNPFYFDRTLGLCLACRDINDEIASLDNIRFIATPQKAGFSAGRQQWKIAIPPNQQKLIVQTEYEVILKPIKKDK